MKGGKQLMKPELRSGNSLLRLMGCFGHPHHGGKWPPPELRTNSPKIPNKQNNEQTGVSDNRAHT